jgi:hypothetical protein
MAELPPSRLLEILKVLARHRVDFVLVGGAAAIVHGAPVSTFDLDILVPREGSGQHLLAALTELKARYVDPAGRQIVPDADKVATLKLHQLVTDLGPLDVMTSIGAGLTYADLVAETSEQEIEGVKVRVLSLGAVIRSKEHANRDKDRMALPVLRRTLEILERR